MNIALIILSIVLAIQTVRSWRYRKLWRSSVDVMAQLIEESDRAVKLNYELECELHRARVAGYRPFRQADAILDEEYLDA